MGQIAHGSRPVWAYTDFTNTDTVACEDADKVDGIGWNWHIDNSGTIVGQDAALNGVARFTTGTTATDLVEIITGTVFRVDAGGITMEARVAAATDLCGKHMFIGFTDNAALETPFESTACADTLVSTATDGVGFMYDKLGTTERWKLVGVDSDTDATQQIVGAADGGTLVADTFQTLKVEVAPAACNSSVATFYIDGDQVGIPMQSAVSSNVALAAVVLVTAQECAANLMDVDFAEALGNRANTC